MLIVSTTINMPQMPMCKGLEVCHVNRLIVLAQKVFQEIFWGISE